MIFGDFGHSFKIIELRHDQIKNKIFTLTSSSNLDFARSGVCMTIPESHEDQINNLNKITILKPEKTIKKLKSDDLINDDFFSKKDITKKKFDRIIELMVEAYMNTDGKLNKEDAQDIINKL
jgi:hypothetical protein